MTSLETRFVVGLGNPGRRYERTRHNLGFMVVEALASAWGAAAPRKAFQGSVWDTRTTFGRVVLLEPETFMNRSGRAVGELVRFYKVEPEDVLIVLDDLALPPGSIRLRASGSAGGHNGLQDVIGHLGTDRIARLRLGIGPSPAWMDSADYVLGKMDESDLADANQAIEKACQAVEDWLAGGIEQAMNKHN